MKEVNKYLNQHETIYASIECEVYKVNTQSTVKLPTNNHDEADSRMFCLCTLFQEQDVIIRSTDTDILSISMVVHNELNLKSCNVIIHYRKSSADIIHCHLNKLVQLVEQDPQPSLLRTRKIPIPRILCEEEAFVNQNTADWKDLLDLFTMGDSSNRLI